MTNGVCSEPPRYTATDVRVWCPNCKRRFVIEDGMETDCPSCGTKCRSYSLTLTRSTEEQKCHTRS